MAEKSILIVEDELIIAESIREILERRGFEVLGIETTADGALRTIEEHKPDLAVLDINLNSERDGIWLAEQIKLNHSLPFIFLTSHADEETLSKGIGQNPYGYLMKPVEEVELFTTITCALSLYEEVERGGTAIQNPAMSDAFFIKDEYVYVKIKYDKILFLKANGNYVEIHTDTKKHLIRTPMKELSPKLPDDKFFKSHRSYLVNLSRIDSFGSSFVQIEDHEIPLSTQYRDELLKRLVSH